MHLLIECSSFLLVFPSVAVLSRTCSFSLAKSFMREASQRLALVCFVREKKFYICRRICHVARSHFSLFTRPLFGADDEFWSFSSSSSQNGSVRDNANAS